MIKSEYETMREPTSSKGLISLHNVAMQILAFRCADLT